jgi:hypothetical protein
MKKLTALALGCLLMVNFAAFGEVSSVDQKWLEAVQNMVEKGEKKVTTSKENRVDLVKEWATKKGFSVKVTKVDGSFQLELSKSIAQK